MGDKEIRKETDWLGREKDVIYENGKKVGETKHETTFWGNPINRTYNNDGEVVSETRHETTFFGTSKEVTRDTEGNKLSETVYEERLFGGNRGVIHQGRDKIGELETEKGIFSGRKQVLHERGRDVDLTRRVVREETSESDNSGGADREDRSYSTHDYPASDSYLSPALPNLSGFFKGFALLGIMGVIIAGLNSYSKTKAARIPLEKRVVSSEPLGKFKEELALYRIGSSTVNVNRPRGEIPAEIKQGLIKLAKLKQIEKNGEVCLNDYASSENNIWVTGESFQNKNDIYTGFICYSPDNGNTWFEQLRLGPSRPGFGKYSNAVPYGIHFFDSKEGWSLTRNSILHTTNGGQTWQRIGYYGDVGILREFYIFNRGTLLVKRMDNSFPPRNSGTWPQYCMEYTTNGGRTWGSYPEWKPEMLGLETEINKKSLIKFETPY